MHPVSKERAEWITARLALLDEMFAELRDRPAKYLATGGLPMLAAQQGFLNQALQNISAEQLQLRVELEVLTKLYSTNNPGPR